MKTFSFMKKALFVALTMVSVVACDENESDGGMQTPFPEQKVEALQAGSETNLTFNASSAWVLESNQLWCKFSNNMTTMSGEAGEQNVTVNITDELQGTASDTADVKLTMSGETKVVLRVIRMGQALSIVDQDGVAYDAEHPVTLSYGNASVSGVFTFAGNFNWVLRSEDLPEWLEVEEGLPIKGTANTEVQMTLNVVKSYWATAHTDTLKFYMQDTETFVAVPVSYNGLPAGIIENEGISGQYWWKISNDGQFYWKENAMGEAETEKTQFSLTFRVLAQDNKYKLIRLEQSGSWMNVTDDYSSFISLTDDGNGNVTVNSFKSNSTGDERVAYILALPDSVYQDLMQKVNGNGGFYDGILLTTDGSDLNSNYDKYVVMGCKQEAAGATTSGEFEVLLQGYLPVSCEQGDGGTGYLEYVASEYNVKSDQIYTVKVTAGSYLVINPMLSTDMWDGNDLSNIVGTTLEGGELNKETWSGGMTQDETGYTVSLIADQSMILVFKGTDSSNKKALIINVQ